jgi:hypothetical protein
MSGSGAKASANTRYRPLKAKVGSTFRLFRFPKGRLPLRRNGGDGMENMLAIQTIKVATELAVAQISKGTPLSIETIAEMSANAAVIIVNRCKQGTADQ